MYHLVSSSDLNSCIKRNPGTEVSTKWTERRQYVRDSALHESHYYKLMNLHNGRNDERQRIRNEIIICNDLNNESHWHFIGTGNKEALNSLEL